MMTGWKRHSLLVIRSCVALVLGLAIPTSLADSVSETGTTQNASTVASTIASSPTPTRVVSIFYIDERSYEGIPYTLIHSDSGAVVGVGVEKNQTMTTYVITTTRVDRRPPPTHSRTDNVTTGIPTLRSRPQLNVTGPPSTITQGPATFMFTGTRFRPDQTVVNRCSLNGTVEAQCNLTHVGAAWYSSDADWNGTYSTYSYNWTSGDRFGFAPVTITEGVHMIGVETPTPSGSPNAAAGRAEGPEALGGCLLAVGAAFVLGVALGL